MVIEAVSIMKEVKPKKVAGEKIGTKVDDYWEPGKALLQDPTKFLESLFKYDKVILILLWRLCLFEILTYLQGLVIFCNNIIRNNTIHIR